MNFILIIQIILIQFMLILGCLGFYSQYYLADLKESHKMEVYCISNNMEYSAENDECILNFDDLVEIK